MSIELKPGMKEGRRYIRTHMGHNFYFDKIEENVISIVDIAHALSHQCRYVGHVSRFYSIAEHSVRVSWCCSPNMAKWGLLHDAAEAYLGDVSSPLKAYLPEYKAMERRTMDRICEEFHMHPEEPAAVKQADLMLLATEGRDLFVNGWPYAEVAAAPLDQKIEPWSASKAKSMFLNRWIEVKSK